MPNPIRVYLEWRGRIPRKTYLLFSIPPAALLLIMNNVELLTDQPIWLDLLQLVGYIVLFITSMMLSIKRSHDRGRTGWFSLLLLVPIIQIWPLIEFGFLKGTHGTNRYGEPAVW